MPDEGQLPVGYPRCPYPVPSADLGNRPCSAVIFLLLRADKKSRGGATKSGGKLPKTEFLNFFVHLYRECPREVFVIIMPY